MLKSKLLLLITLFLSSQCFAYGTFEAGKEYLYYTTSDLTIVYRGKVKSILYDGVYIVQFERLQTLVDSPECGGGLVGSACNIKKYLNANKKERPLLVETLLDAPISYPTQQLISVRVD